MLRVEKNRCMYVEVVKVHGYRLIDHIEMVKPLKVAKTPPCMFRVRKEMLLFETLFRVSYAI